MPVLIDGHNLIGKLPDLRLDDPDDEAKLALRLRAYAARTKRRVTVVFDQGLPGGRDEGLSGGGVEVVFASPGRSADGILRERIARARDPRGLLVVSSDQRVIAAAQAQQAKVMRAEEFVSQLSGPLPSAGEERDVRLTEDEVAEWARLFARGPKKRRPGP